MITRVNISVVVALATILPCFAEKPKTPQCPPAATTAAPAESDRGTPPTMAWVDADTEPRAVLLCVHGLGLHNNSFEAFGKRMTKEGVAVYAVDVRGFGSFVNNLGNDKVDFDGCLEKDIKRTLRVIHRAHPGLPVFLLGESMGGAIALRATERYPDLVDGLISCVPSGDRFGQAKTDLKVALHLIGGGNNKQFDIGSSVVKAAAKGNQRLANDWLEQKLNRKELSPKELMQFQAFMNDNHESAKKITSKPVLVVQGWNDNLVKATGTLKLWEELGTPDKDFMPIWGADHLIFEESQFNDPAVNAKADKVVIRWMRDHIKKSAEADKQRSAKLN
jgi:alpha-beta hydrolase superfamily lysophospholipase